MPVPGIFGTTIELLGKTLDLRAKRHAVISANLANVETPGYTPGELSFESELKGALRNKGQAPPSHPRHLPLKGGAASLLQVQGTLIEAPDAGEGRDGNGVQLEAQMGRMAENQIMYNASVQLLNKKFEMMKQAIKGAL